MRLDFTYPLPYYRFNINSCFNTYCTTGETEAQRNEFTFLEVRVRSRTRIPNCCEAGRSLASPVQERNQDTWSDPVTLLLTSTRTSNSPGWWELSLSRVSPLPPTPRLLHIFPKTVYFSLKSLGVSKWSLSHLKARQVKAKFFIFLVSRHQWTKPNLLGLGPAFASLVLNPALCYEDQALDALLEMSLHRIQLRLVLPTP